MTDVKRLLLDYEAVVDAAWALVVALDNPQLAVVEEATENLRAALRRLHRKAA